MATRVEGLDALRGFAAIAVAIFHTVILRKLYPTDQLPTFFIYLYLAVPLFFAISAFSLCLGYVKSGAIQGGVTSFLWRRFLRIAPLFYLMALIWTLSRRSLPEAEAAILNVSFLFNLAPVYHTSLVPAGWSLGVEMLMYLAFPLLIIFARDITRAIATFVATFGAAVASGITISWLAVPEMYDWMFAIVQLPFFAAGIVMFHLFERLDGQRTTIKKLLSAALIVGTLLLLVAISAAGFSNYRVMGWNLGRHLLCLALMPLVIAFALHGFRVFVNPATVFIGTVSYGIYLIHPWLVYRARDLQNLLTKVGADQHLTAVLTIAAVLVLSVSLAALSYYAFESRIVRWGRARNAASFDIKRWWLGRTETSVAIER